MSNRKIVATLGALLLLILAGVLAWRFAIWHQAGWTGLRYQPPPYEIKGKKQPPPNLGPFSTEAGRIDFVIPGSPAEQAGIVAGDKVIRVNGHDIREQNALRKIADASRTGDRIEYELVREKATRIVSVRSVSPLTLPAVAVNIAAACLAALVFVIIAVLVFWYTPRSRSAWVFFWFCATSAFGFALTALTDLDVNNFAGIDAVMLRPGLYVIYALAGMAGFAVSALLLHLALVFPSERPIVRRHPMIVRWLHLAPWIPLAILTGFISGAALPRGARPIAGGVLFVIGIALGLLLVRRLQREGATGPQALLDHPWLVSGAISLSMGGLLGLLMPVFRRGNPLLFGVVLGLSLVAVYTTLFLAYSISTLATLVRSYRQSNVEQKRQVRWPLWGTVVAVSLGLLVGVVIVILVTLVPGLNWWVLAGTGAVSRLIYILVPVSFAFAILKYRLMDIDVIIRKTVIYSAVTGFIVVMFFVLVAGLGTWITSWLEVQSQTVTVISTLLLAGSFVPVRNRVQRFVDRRFFRRKFDADQAERAIQQEILHATELQPLLAKIAEVVQQTLQVRSVVILAPRAEAAGVFVPLAAIGVADAPLRDLEIDRGSIPAGARSVPSSGLRLSETEHALLRRMSAELAVPAALRGRVRGLLLTGSMLSGSYDDDDRDFALRAAEQVALAIDNLAVSDEVRDYERALEIQRALVPTSMPRVEGVDVDAAWQPARIVGGDYFDVFTLGDSLALCIGDVAGKGMPAALLMANLQAAVKATAAPEMPPSAVCQRVSQVVTGTLTGGRFVTFFYGTLDRASRTLRYCNAGHNPPLLIRRDGGVAPLTTGGPAFARLMHGTAYTNAEEKLEAGDVVVLFTDGVTEARNAAEEEFGEERLIEVVRRGERGASVIVRDIIEAVARFSDNIAHDDVTLVVLRPA